MSLDHLAKALGIKTKAMSAFSETSGGALRGAKGDNCCRGGHRERISECRGDDGAFVAPKQKGRKAGVEYEWPKIRANATPEELSALAAFASLDGKSAPIPKTTSEVAGAYHESLGVEDGHQPGFEEESELKELEPSDLPGSDMNTNMRARNRERSQYHPGEKTLAEKVKGMQDASIDAADRLVARMSCPPISNTPGGDRRRLSLSSPQLANSEFGSEAIMPAQAERAQHKLSARLTTEAGGMSVGERQTSDFLGRLSGRGTRQEQFVTALVKPSPQRESERMQTAVADNGNRKSEKPFRKVAGRQSNGKAPYRP
jgi:hypothetical protein